MTATTYRVIGQLDDKTNHTFGDYPRLQDAKQVWASHDGLDGPVRIEQLDGNGDVVRVWVSVDGDLTDTAETDE
jgi:hypothetical protein